MPPEAVGQLRQISLRGLGATKRVADIPNKALELQAAVDVIDPNGQSLLLGGMEPLDFEGKILGLGEQA